MVTGRSLWRKAKSGLVLVIRFLPGDRHLAALEVCDPDGPPALGGTNDGAEPEFESHIEPDRLDEVVHTFLISGLVEVLASYRRVRADVSLDDLGLARRVEIFEQVRAGGGLVPAVLGAADVLRDPERLLALLCEAARMDFLPAMLAWPAGLRASGGVWAKRWYASLEAWAGIMPMPQERARARRPGTPGQGLRALLRSPARTPAGPVAAGTRQP